MLVAECVDAQIIAQKREKFCQKTKHTKFLYNPSPTGDS